MMKNKVQVIGGVTVDIEGYPHQVLTMKDSNPGNVNIAIGGVGCNIAQNLSKMGLPTQLFSKIGQDFLGKQVLEKIKASEIDGTYLMEVPGSNTAVYLSVLNHDHDMALAINDMAIFDTANPLYFNALKSGIKDAHMVVLDTNLREDEIHLALEKAGDIPVFLDTVSTYKAKKVKKIIGRFHTIKPNVLEAQALTGLTIDCFDQLQKAGEFFLNQGVKQVFITDGPNGVYYKDEKTEGRIKKEAHNIISATGAGDGFSAGIIYGYNKGYSIKEVAEIGTSAAVIALDSEAAVNPSMSESLLIATYEKLFKEKGEK